MLLRRLRRLPTIPRCTRILSLALHPWIGRYPSMLRLYASMPRFATLLHECPLSTGARHGLPSHHRSLSRDRRPETLL
jgi:hypothetical protein